MASLNRVPYFVKNGDKRGPIFFTKRGLRQGDPMSPILFNIYIMGLQRMFIEGLPQIGGFVCSHAAFADDLLMANHKTSGLQKMLAHAHYCK